MRKLISALKRFFFRPFEMYKDLKLQCAECGDTFRFEWGEQQFFKSRGLTPPKRCTGCRSGGRRRSRAGSRNDGRPAPASFRDDRPRRDAGPRRDGGPRNDGPRRDEGSGRGREDDDDRRPSRYVDDSPFYGEGGDNNRRRGRWRR